MFYLFTHNFGFFKEPLGTLVGSSLYPQSTRKSPFCQTLPSSSRSRHLLQKYLRLIENTSIESQHANRFAMIERKVPFLHNTIANVVRLKESA